MSENFPAPPVSPRHYLCDLDYSKFGEQLNKLENSPKLSKSEREVIRYRWLQLIVKLNKNRSMQPLYKYLKDSSFIQSVNKFQTRIYLKKMQRALLRKKWLKLKSQIIEKQRSERFDNKAIKVRGVRVKQTSLYLTTINTDYIDPDFSGLFKLSISPSLEAIHSLRGEGLFEEERKALLHKERKESQTHIHKEREVKIEKEEKKNHFLRKENLKLYCIFILVGLIIGYILYRCYNQKLYSFLKMKDSDIQQMTTLPKDKELSFSDIKGPSQNSVLQHAINDVNETASTN